MRCAECGETLEVSRFGRLIHAYRERDSHEPVVDSEENDA